MCVESGSGSRVHSKKNWKLPSRCILGDLFFLIRLLNFVLRKQPFLLCRPLNRQRHRITCHHSNTLQIWCPYKQFSSLQSHLAAGHNATRNFFSTEAEVDAVGRQFEHQLTAGCVCMLVAPLSCGLGCCSRTVVVFKAAAKTRL